jgi:hypothetical protein
MFARTQHTACTSKERKKEEEEEENIMCGTTHGPALDDNK